MFKFSFPFLFHDSKQPKKDTCDCSVPLLGVQFIKITNIKNTIITLRRLSFHFTFENACVGNSIEFQHKLTLLSLELETMKLMQQTSCSL